MCLPSDASHNTYPCRKDSSVIERPLLTLLFLRHPGSPAIQCQKWVGDEGELAGPIVRTRSGLRGQRCQSAGSSASSGGTGSIFPEGACAVGQQTWALTSEVRFCASFTPSWVTSSEFLNLVESWFPQLQSRGVTEASGDGAPRGPPQ